METDVLVVGAGPGGSATAYHLARHGIDVTIVERSAFPREKVCGDGLTPRGVAALLKMGVDPHEPGFERVKGLRVHSREATIELPFPTPGRSPTTAWFGRGTTSTRCWSQRAEKAGARLMERTEAVAPSSATAGCGSDDPALRRRRTRSRRRSARASWSRRTAPRPGSRKPAGVTREESRPLGIAARRYYRMDYQPGPVARVVARPVGGRPPAPRVRLAVPGGGRHDQPRRRPAEHVQELQGRLGAAAVQRVRDDAAAVVRRLGGDRRGARALRAAPHELQPFAAGGAGHAAGRRCRRCREPVQR